MFVPRIFAVAVVALTAIGSAQASSRLKLKQGEDGSHFLTVSASGGDATTVSIACTPRLKEYALILIVDGLDPPLGGADVTISSDRTSIGQFRFDAEQESFMLLRDGDGGRQLIERVSAGRSLDIAIASTQIVFTLADGVSEVAAFRELCALRPQ